MTGLAEDGDVVGVLDMFVRDHEDVAFGDGADGLDDRDSVLIPTSFIDACDDLGIIVDDGAESAGAVFKRLDGFDFEEHFGGWNDNGGGR